MIARRPLGIAVLMLALGLAPACKGEGEGEAAKSSPAAVEVLDPPANGSPVAAKFVKFTGEADPRGAEILLYNAGDRTAFSYALLLRYYDANDQLLRIEVGTPVEGDTDFTSITGKPWRCEPKANRTLKLDGEAIRVPTAAVRAEVVVSRVSAPVTGGNRIDEWFAQQDVMAWPAG